MTPPAPTSGAARLRAPALVRRRLAVLFLAMALGLSAVVVRLAKVQALDTERYVAFGESQRLRAVTLSAERGSIFDRRGRDMALTIRKRTVWANPRLVSDPLAAASALAAVLGTGVESLRDRLTRDAAFVYLARKVDDAVADKVAGLKLDGVFLLEEPARYLPADDLAVPLIGKVGLDNNGLSGLERQYESELAGKPGKIVVERDPHGTELYNGVRRFAPSARGDDLILTIDVALQYETEGALADAIVRSNARGGMALVMETATGDILSMANLRRLPGASGSSPAQLTGPAERATALTDVFEPGSVNKLITIAGALETRAVQPTDRLAVPDKIKVGNHVFSDHEPHAVVPWSITDIMANSSNVGTIMIASRLGKDRLNRYLHEFGFGAKSGMHFPGESAGLLNPPAKWYSTDMGTIPIGQGGVSVTAVQMLAAYNTVANGGLYVAPRVVAARMDRKGVRQPAPASLPRRVISGSTAREVTAMLNEVVRVGTGTLAAIDGYTVAGKTGTARKPLAGGKGYKQGAYMSSFAGFVPSEKPAFTAMVILDEPVPIFGGLVAAPVFARIAGYGLREFRVPPPPPALPTAAPSSEPAAAAAVGEAGAPPPTGTLGPSPKP